MPPKFSVSPENDFLFSREHYMSENYKNELVQEWVSRPAHTNSAALQNLLRDWDKREYVKLSYLKGSCPTSTVSIKLTWTGRVITLLRQD